MVNQFTGLRVVKTLSEWLLEEIQQRHLSIREFAKRSGVAHGTLLNILDSEQAGARYPSVETLVKLSRATGTDLCTLVSMLAPSDTLTEPDTLVLATRIKNLTPEAQSVLEDWLMGRLLKGGDKS